MFCNFSQLVVGTWGPFVQLVLCVCNCSMLDEISSKQLITAKLQGSTGLRDTDRYHQPCLRDALRLSPRGTTGFFHFLMWDILLPLAWTADRRDQCFCASSARHRQSDVDEIAQARGKGQVSKRQQEDSNDNRCTTPQPPRLNLS